MSDLIIFDLDNTIIRGDSDRNWGEFLSEQGIVDKDYKQKSELFYGDYHDGNLDIDSFLNFCVQPLKDNPMDMLLELRKKFIETKIKPIVLEKAKKIINEELKRNEVMIATATNSFVTSPISELFSVENLVATEFEIENNAFTGKVLGEPCFREGKLSKVKNWAESHHYDLRRATFFSDSLNDLPLLNAVGKPIIVDGDSELEAVAKTNNWECISFR
tara:strand:- start:641 stop:1291 length:651 start_codon:yes stop_codon:yes gene_type:complete